MTLSSASANVSSVGISTTNPLLFTTSNAGGRKLRQDPSSSPCSPGETSHGINSYQCGGGVGLFLVIKGAVGSPMRIVAPSVFVANFANPGQSPPPSVLPVRRCSVWGSESMESRLGGHCVCTHASRLSARLPATADIAPLLHLQPPPPSSPYQTMWVGNLLFGSYFLTPVSGKATVSC